MKIQTLKVKLNLNTRVLQNPFQISTKKRKITQILRSIDWMKSQGIRSQMQMQQAKAKTIDFHKLKAVNISKIRFRKVIPSRKQMKDLLSASTPSAGFSF